VVAKSAWPRMRDTVPVPRFHHQGGEGVPQVVKPRMGEPKPNKVHLEVAAHVARWKGYYSEHPMGATGGALATIAIAAVMGAFLLGTTAWLSFNVTLPIFFGR
jgi:hypothetical protein